MTRLLPGLALAAAATAALLGLTPVLATAAPSLSPLVLALLAGAAAGSVLGVLARRAPGGATARVRDAVGPGTAWTARHLLRAGVVLLGLQLSVANVLGLGWRGLVVVAVTVATTFAGTLAIGRRLRVPRDTALLLATGFSICGAAAVSAVSGVLDRAPARPDRAHRHTGADRPEDGPVEDLAGSTGAALAMVALFGTAAVLVLPPLADALGLRAEQAGLWIGAGVQEVAQVVAAAGALPLAPAAVATALATATVAKLARVVLLAPLVAGVGAVRGRRVALAAPVGAAGPAVRTRTARRGGPALVPGFVVGFLVAVGLRSLGVVPDAVLTAAGPLGTGLFVAAMFSLGLGVDVPRLVRSGSRTLLLGAASAVVVTGTSLAAVLLLVP
ncbi:putative sulfate exporter family transporter [Isoptericola sp. AK164]|uniref:YeiH family protein n=1 Tax=Isoptericola sp. AK164 TaxID=3024246 RepID=UPI0024186C01|nr:putative sulfate exporter family transporter [Isoptericola sp. AK164]